MSGNENHHHLHLSSQHGATTTTAQQQQEVCDALCSLSQSSGSSPPPTSPTAATAAAAAGKMNNANKPAKKKSNNKSCCPKQLQLPMFLSKTYHMIDKCDSTVATWSDHGDNFVVKNVEKFASVVLPLYFKHSNFSSFARQLNFYGFRKLRTDPILTSEVDPCTACYVRFYHENFQRDKPELLQQIKRATKGDQQSKDDMDSLRKEIYQLKDMLRTTVADYDRKLAELSYECNRRITSMNAEYDKLAVLVQTALGPNLVASAHLMSAVASSTAATQQHHHHSAATAMSNMNSSAAGSNKNSSEATNAASASHAPNPAVNADLLHSLSQAAYRLQSDGNAAAAAAAAVGEMGNGHAGNKRPSAEIKDEGEDEKRSSRPKGTGV